VGKVQNLSYAKEKEEGRFIAKLKPRSGLGPVRKSYFDSPFKARETKRSAYLRVRGKADQSKRRQITRYNKKKRLKGPYMGGLGGRRKTEVKQSEAGASSLWLREKLRTGRQLVKRDREES